MSVSIFIEVLQNIIIILLTVTYLLLPSSTVAVMLKYHSVSPAVEYSTNIKMSHHYYSSTVATSGS